MAYMVAVADPIHEKQKINLTLAKFLADHLTAEESFYSRSLGAVEAVDAKTSTLADIISVLLQHAPQQAIEEVIAVINRNISYPKDEGTLVFVSESIGEKKAVTRKLIHRDPMADEEEDPPPLLKEMAESASSRIDLEDTNEADVFEQPRVSAKPRKAPRGFDA